jgi:hypothetical protein
MQTKGLAVLTCDLTLQEENMMLEKAIDESTRLREDNASLRKLAASETSALQKEVQVGGTPATYLPSVPCDQEYLS